ncbi:MAG TPA: AraC family transcriptional regulator [Clostridiaceae bacterium]|nr:AraC family transcriptional regulator [Clostridiaceae bacterium]
MQALTHNFTSRQYMITPDFEYFHYADKTATEIEYHNHDFYEIYFFISGKVTYMIEGKAYKLKPGDILLIHNNELHKPLVEQGELYERIVIWLNPEFLKKESKYDTDLSTCFQAYSHDKNNLLRPDPEALRSLKNIINKFENACNSTGYGSNILKDLYLIEFIIHINKCYLESYGSMLHDGIEYNKKVSAIIQYINENIQSDLSLDLLSKKFYLSKYHLLREFKKYTGYTIHQYIRTKRLLLAKSFLKEGLAVTEVCNKCGFSDYSNFIRAFKNAFGAPPKTYMKLK